MTIACLGWGSLCWDPRSLPVVGDWHEDGPFLPVEFTRVSSDGRITLVLTDGVQTLPVLWAELDVTDLDQAISALAKREDVRSFGAIGRWPTDRPNRALDGTIQNWAIAHGIDGVVWTALKPGMDVNSRGVIPTHDQLRSHVATLTPQARAHALHYVARAPQQVDTALRPFLMDLLAARDPPERPA